MMGSSFRAGFAALAFAFLAGSGALRAQSIDPATGKELAPSGHLRVGIYAGSPTSQVTDPQTKEKHGVTYDLGKESPRGSMCRSNISPSRALPT
jgi:polar amino acid transport system substrate-binding protein